jgi:hypothetical protein
MVADKFPNLAHGRRLSDLICLREEEIMVTRKLQRCFVYRHSDFEGKELHAVRRWSTVESEGSDTQLFGQTIIPVDTEETETEAETEIRLEIPTFVRNAGNRAEDIAEVRALGFVVDDDNEPAPENIPTPTENANIEATDGLAWGWAGIDHRKQANGTATRARINCLSGIALQGATLLTMLLLFLPRKFMEEVMLVETNSKIHGSPVTFGEFLRFLGLWLYMSTLSGFRRSDYWSSKPISMLEGAPYRFNDFMTCKRFEAILLALTYTNEIPPAYKDKFWEVRQIITAWNTNMAEIFTPSWVSCLDESMSPWNNRWTCPGWMFVPRKPHPFGNEYHSICCAETMIMYGIELVEGSDTPPQRPRDPNERLGKTVGLLLRLCKPIYSRGFVVILDSGFCVLRGIVELRKKGVFAAAVIKKRKYWPKHVPGAAMDERMEAKAVGDCDSLPGTLEGIPYDLFVLKDAGYTMKIMSTYGSLLVSDGQKDSIRHYKNEAGQNVTTRFKYMEPFANHFLYRHCVDDHNNLRHAGVSIEETWRTHRWANRVFAFLLAISEVNAFLAFRSFIWDKSGKKELLHFRRQLALALINNEWHGDKREASPATRKRQIAHTMTCAPRHASKFLNGKWICKAKAPYQQHVCRGRRCKKQVRTHCKCTPGHWLCNNCFQNHVLDEYSPS